MGAIAAGEGGGGGDERWIVEAVDGERHEFQTGDAVRYDIKMYRDYRRNRSSRDIDHLQIDHLQWIVTCRFDMLCRLCIRVVQVQPRKYVLQLIMQITRLSPGNMS